MWFHYAERERFAFLWCPLRRATTLSEREKSFVVVWGRPVRRATTLSGRKESFFLFGGTDFSGSLCNQVFFCLKKNREIEHSH
jgi:hypothetical protein